MGNSTGRILKAKDVKLDGHFCVNTGQITTGTGNAPRQGGGGNVKPQVNVIENQAEYAIGHVPAGPAYVLARSAA